MGSPCVKIKICEASLIKIILAVLILIILQLQYRLWLGDASIFKILDYQTRLEQLQKQSQSKQERNEALYAEVKDLRKGKEAIEERARYELGMIKKNETFFQVIE